MKCMLILLIAVEACAAKVLKDTIQDYKEGDRYFYFAGDDGIIHLIDTEEPIDTDIIESYLRNPDNNAYWLFTRTNPTTAQILVFGNISSIRNSNYDSSKSSVFIAHGWNGNGDNYMNQLLTDAILLNDDINVIVVDWSKLANRSYSTAKAGTAAVGISLAQFIRWFVTNNLFTYDKIHLIGFSLGGHLVGNAGRETGAAIARITALDPAGPLWSSDNNRIMSTDAQYVEVIHTNTGFLGYTEPCGAADFYPNGGSRMPGCWFSPCSHSRAYEYMASSIKYNHFMANKCADHKEASRDKCTGPRHPMGNNELNKPGRGIFRVNTGKNYPY